MLLQKQVELKKQYFKNKNLIVYVNHVLLGFYLCQSRIYKYYGFNNAQLKIAQIIKSIKNFKIWSYYLFIRFIIRFV